MRYDPNKDLDDYFFFVIKDPHDTPDTLWDECAAKMKDWRNIRDKADLYNQSLGHICFPVYNQLTLLGSLARAWRSPYCRSKCPHCQGDAYFIPDKYQDMVLPRDYDVPPWQEKWEYFYKVRESIQFKCPHCGKTFRKDVSKEEYIDQHLKFGELLWTHSAKKDDSVKIGKSKNFYDPGTSYEELEYLLWEDEPYQIEGASKETLVGIIRSYEKLGYIYCTDKEKEDLPMDKLKEIIRRGEKNMR